MSSSTRSVRTYSRRRSARNSFSLASSALGRDESSSAHVSDDELGRPRKRRALIHTSTERDVVDSPRVTPRRHPSRSKMGTPTLGDDPGDPASILGISTAAKGSEKTTVKDKGKALDGTSRTYLDCIPTTPDKRREGTPTESDSSVSPIATPKRKPKDLSNIFDAVSPQRKARFRQESMINSHGSNRTIQKMLSRSRTESSLDSPPSKASQCLPRSQSFADPSSISHPPRSDSPPTGIRTLHVALEASAGPSGSGLQQSHREHTNTHRTYAGRSRSFLVALPATALVAHLGEPVANQNMADEADEQLTRDSYTELRKRWGVDNSENDTHHDADDNALPVGEGLALYNPLSSITDLRSKGETRRFLDEVGYLFEGLEPTGALSVRRSSAFDIVSKLCNQDFWRKTKAAGLLVEIWDQLRGAGAGNGDKVLDPILSCFVSLASEDFRNITFLASKDDFVETVVQLMTTHMSNDPFFIGESNDNLRLTRIERMTAQLSRLRDEISKNTSIVHEDCKPSTRLLLSNVFSAVPSLAFPHLTTVMDSVTSDLASVSSRLTAFRTGLPLFPASINASASHEKLCFEHIYNSLSILDLYLIEVENIGGPCLSKVDLQQSYNALAGDLVSLTVVADILDRSAESGTLRSLANRCSELAFRVLINLSNGNSAWCEAVVADPYTLPILLRLIITSLRSIVLPVTKDAEPNDNEDALDHSMDLLCLALALLTNLVQERKEVASALQSLSFDPSCQGHKSCLLGCRCTMAVSAISGLVDIYITLSRDDSDEMAPEFDFLRGHLAVLIGLLLLQIQGSKSSPITHAARSVIGDLPGPHDSVQRKIDALIVNVDDFSALYVALTSRVGTARSKSRKEESPGSHVPSLVMGSAGEKMNHNVVLEVATSLKTLRRNL
ncbi:hypothetical protein M0805_001058 [Coniferiporia weirii]|nr:hypothetical protein M0805_001058 [Coniferiporia weirii]